MSAHPLVSPSPSRQGAWRKVTVDDQLPYQVGEELGEGEGEGEGEKEGEGSQREKPLLPRTSNPAELWPALLSKAVLKIAALE